MDDVYIRVRPAPTSPLNLQLGVIYAPRCKSGFAAFDAIEVGDQVFQVRGHHADGTIAVLFTGHLLRTYQHLAAQLGMVGR